MSQFQVKKVPILIASTLKPVMDVRAFGKLAVSIGETNKYKLFIIGFSIKRPASKPGFRFFSSMSHFDSRLDRLVSQMRFIYRLIQIQPKILICCTYEYLPIASFFKSFLNYRLVYDVQENYLKNLDLNPDLSDASKVKAAALIQKAESVQGIDFYFLAEKCYADEMPEKKPFLVLENKFNGALNQQSPIFLKGKRTLRFCITGTITPSFGILEAVTWFKKILLSFPEVKLVIIGHCPIKSFKKKLEKAAKETLNLRLHLDQNPRNHEELMKVLQNSDFALLPYQNHPAIRNKMPTKLFECAALGIPVLISPNAIWEDFLSDFNGGFPIDFLDKTKAAENLKTALNQTFFTCSPPDNILWKTEKPQFQQTIEDLLS